MDRPRPCGGPRMGGTTRRGPRPRARRPGRWDGTRSHRRTGSGIVRIRRLGPSSDVPSHPASRARLLPEWWGGPPAHDGRRQSPVMGGQQGGEAPDPVAPSAARGRAVLEGTATAASAGRAAHPLDKPTAGVQDKPADSDSRGAGRAARLVDGRVEVYAFAELIAGARPAGRAARCSTRPGPGLLPCDAYGIARRAVRRRVRGSWRGAGRRSPRLAPAPALDRPIPQGGPGRPSSESPARRRATWTSPAGRKLATLAPTRPAATGSMAGGAARSALHLTDRRRARPAAGGVRDRSSPEPPRVNTMRIAYRTARLPRVPAVAWSLRLTGDLAARSSPRCTTCTAGAAADRNSCWSHSPAGLDDGDSRKWPAAAARTHGPRAGGRLVRWLAASGSGTGPRRRQRLRPLANA